MAMLAVFARSWARVAPHTHTVRNASNSAFRPVPKSLPNITTPKQFLEAISKQRRNLAENSACVAAVGENWEDMFRLTSEKLKGAGISPQDRKYLLWSLEKFRQQKRPCDFAYDVKKKKVVRGCGPRVQKGFRIRGVPRPGERRA
ncbi:hypothetical protein MVES1_000420 [Malassezia vespertilionis]|uniref:Small ribosomal subunit protein mS41 n=1 Tax=Malassezia vespertilionis TaxID=2020962 RepID=A0A2N1JGN1_9BASI|nr:uncharacterized protein MVES1_000420 [Malassezia vespertilionis]PKI85703.1 hypothetical protein MVES_000392 [Malassezia vespertilionis]WFD05094.1 hypothetical protein MVES1_000420 [Malassezia vespertilionis]